MAHPSPLAAISAEPIDKRLNQALALFKEGRIEEAEAAYIDVLQRATARQKEGLEEQERRTSAGQNPFVLREGEAPYQRHWPMFWRTSALEALAKIREMRGDTEEAFVLLKQAYKNMAFLATVAMFLEPVPGQV